MLRYVLLAITALSFLSEAAPIEQATSRHAIVQGRSSTARISTAFNPDSPTISSIAIVPLQASLVLKTEPALTLYNTAGTAVITQRPSTTIQTTFLPVPSLPTSEPTSVNSLPLYVGARKTTVLIPQTSLRPTAATNALYATTSPVSSASQPSVGSIEQQYIPISTESAVVVLTITAPQYQVTPTTAFQEVGGIPVSVQPGIVFLTIG